METISLQSFTYLPEINNAASIVIVNYNSGDKLIRCLGSLVKTVPPDVEIIVVDNASVDGSAGSVESLYPQVRLIHSRDNLGFGASNNLGARHAGGKYLVVLNPDTTVDTGWLEPLISALEADPQTGLSTPQILLMHDPSTINACGNRIHISGLTLCQKAGLPRDISSKAQIVSAISGAAFAIRRDLFEEMGGFDEDFFLYVEDSDLSWRVRLAGYQVVCVPNSIVYHAYTLHFGVRKTFYQERNRYLMLLKNLRRTSLLILLPVLLLAEIVTWGYVLSKARWQWSQKLQAYLWVFAHWKETARKHNQVQMWRKKSDREILQDHGFCLDYSQTGAGWFSWLARSVFDPLFFLMRWLSLRLIY